MISTHVLDTALGLPAAGIEVVLDVRHAADWATVGRGTTDSQGRIASFSNAVVADGTYRLMAPLVFTAADSGMNGHKIMWQAATGAQIAEAFRSRARLFDPTLKAHPEFVDLWRQLTVVSKWLRVAYDILSNPTTRAAYDQKIAQATPEGPSKT